MPDVQLQPVEDGAITSTPGFQAAGVASGLKPDGALDLALIYSAQPCTGAAMFTTNAFKAAPVLYDQMALARNPDGLRGVVINSGCANACTGEQGLRDAGAMAAGAAATLGVGVEDVMVMSTGVIGALLPMSTILAGMAEAARGLSSCARAGHDAARAIMTTDTRPKEMATRVITEEGQFVIAGMAKGAGMIHPNMATMLCLITSNVQIAPELAQRALRDAVDRSFHMISVDGDTSTNDTVLLMANGLADTPPIESSASATYRGFVRGLSHVAVELAKAIVRDGEGATRLVEITVRGARSRGEAKQVAMSVARSMLVKTAIYGQDANWGRIVCAVGYSGVTIEPELVRIWLGDLELVRGGAPYDTNEERASEILAQPEIGIGIDLGQGRELDSPGATATVWTCDLSHGYVDINSHYRT